MQSDLCRVHSWDKKWNGKPLVLKSVLMLAAVPCSLYDANCYCWSLVRKTRERALSNRRQIPNSSVAWVKTHLLQPLAGSPVCTGAVLLH